MPYQTIRGRANEQLAVSSTGYLFVTLENLEFFDNVDGTTLNTNLWNPAVSTMTVTQTGSFINVNPTTSVTSNAYANLSSIQQFYISPTNPLYIRFTVQASQMVPSPNTTLEAGWGTAATNAAPTDGVFVRVNNAGANLVLNNNGTETLFPFTVLPTSNTTYNCYFHIYGTKCKFFIDDVLIVEALMPTSQAQITNNSRQPLMFRVYNGTSPTVTPTLKIGGISVQQLNANFNKPYSDKLIGMSRSAVQHPSTYATVVNYANSAAPASATLSNTAAGYTTLGGQFQFAAVSGAETDYALFGFQVPAGFQFYASDIRISTYNTGAVGSAITPTILQWAAAVNSSAVSLATADGAGTWAPRAITIGTQAFGLSAVIGAVANDITWSPQHPICIEGGRFFHIILKMPSGVNTASQVIRGTVSINGYFE
jgi:hypothetical protein